MALSAPQYWPTKSTSETFSGDCRVLCGENAVLHARAGEVHLGGSQAGQETDLPSRVSASAATRIPLPLTTTRRMFLMVLLS